MYAIKDKGKGRGIQVRSVKAGWELEDGETLVDSVPRKAKDQEFTFKSGKVGVKKKVKRNLTAKQKLEQQTGLTLSEIKQVLEV